MADVIFVAIAVAFFGICVLYVRACEHIIGPDETPDDLDAELLDLTETERAE